MVLLLRFLNGPAIYAPWRQWGMYSLDGKVATVTGASEGIGAELAHLLRSKGCRRVLAARNEAKLRAVAGPEACIVAGDLTGEAICARVVETALESFGGIDVLINNAGRGHYGSALNTPVPEARDLFANSAQGCAAAIVAGLEHGRSTVVTHRSGWLLVWFNRLLPGLVQSSMEMA